jgi:hypothetical protein
MCSGRRCSSKPVEVFACSQRTENDWNRKIKSKPKCYLANETVVCPNLCSCSCARLNKPTV